MLPVHGRCVNWEVSEHMLSLYKLTGQCSPWCWPAGATSGSLFIATPATSVTSVGPSASASSYRLTCSHSCWASCACATCAWTFCSGACIGASSCFISITRPCIRSGLTTCCGSSRSLWSDPLRIGSRGRIRLRLARARVGTRTTRHYRRQSTIERVNRRASVAMCSDDTTGPDKATTPRSERFPTHDT